MSKQPLNQIIVGGTRHFDKERRKPSAAPGTYRDLILPLSQAGIDTAKLVGENLRKEYAAEHGVYAGIGIASNHLRTQQSLQSIAQGADTPLHLVDTRSNIGLQGLPLDPYIDALSISLGGIYADRVTPGRGESGFQRALLEHCYFRTSDDAPVAAELAANWLDAFIRVTEEGVYVAREIAEHEPDNKGAILALVGTHGPYQGVAGAVLEGTFQVDADARRVELIEGHDYNYSMQNPGIYGIVLNAEGDYKINPMIGLKFKDGQGGLFRFEALKRQRDTLYEHAQLQL